MLLLSGFSSSLLLPSSTVSGNLTLRFFRIPFGCSGVKVKYSKLASSLFYLKLLNYSKLFGSSLIKSLWSISYIDYNHIKRLIIIYFIKFKFFICKYIICIYILLRLRSLCEGGVSHFVNLSNNNFFL